MAFKCIERWKDPTEWLMRYIALMSGRDGGFSLGFFQVKLA